MNPRDPVFQWYMEKLSGTLSPQEEAMLEQLLQQDASFREQWEALEKEGEQLQVQTFLEQVDTAEGLQQLKAALQQRAPGVHRRRKTFQLSAAAAILLALLTTAYFIFFNKKPLVNKETIAAKVQERKPAINLQLGNGRAIIIDNDQQQQTIAIDQGTLQAGKGTLQYNGGDTALNTLSIPTGENYQLQLADGSTVWLNAGTTLRFPFRFAQKNREVFVEGEAYFKVAKDVQHPFIVHTALTSIRVTGTAFNVNTYQEGNIRTALVEGKVIVQGRDGKSAVLQPGLEASYEPAKGITLEPFEEEEVLSWMNGLYYFHDMPVTELAIVASRLYGINIVPDKEKFAGKSITGVLDRNKLIEFLNDLELVAHIKYRFAGNTLYLQ